MENRTDRILKQSKKMLAVAELQRSTAKNILEPNVVTGDKELTALMTTIDGTLRPVTYDDLRTFKYRIAALRSRVTKQGFKGGVSPKTLIKLSLEADRRRAHSEIKVVSPLRKDKEGLAVFRTNASPQSNDTYHIVKVRFLNFKAVLSAGKLTPALLQQITDGQVTVDCDCGRHRYWYRYVATSGGFSEGTPETGYPKIRNPKLVGAACKHVLRVMAYVTQSPNFKIFLREWINLYREKPTAKAKNTNLKEREALEKALKLESWRQRAVKVKDSKKPSVDAMAKEKAKKMRQEGAKAFNDNKRKLDEFLSKGFISQESYDLAIQKMTDGMKNAS